MDLATWQGISTNLFKASQNSVTNQIPLNQSRTFLRARTSL